MSLISLKSPVTLFILIDNDWPDKDIASLLSLLCLWPALSLSCPLCSLLSHKNPVFPTANLMLVPTLAGRFTTDCGPLVGGATTCCKCPGWQGHY